MACDKVKKSSGTFNLLAKPKVKPLIGNIDFRQLYRLESHNDIERYVIMKLKTELVHDLPTMVLQN